ncbi:hypothetical protein CANCADRAFT_72942 [Tortispora caseinolytica NRRL Y-17796]|uniref:Uncharacterized protein n=1 Tax=Tortispora caseinolytica NRRL Y-17796 TaxID=767744 RepID=A0A1E4TIJ8_9ASCO|nr:hypothetical protein CANCADRAFT_72942 [Tortispora caseinolytica NRRL Y-17796]
MDRSKALSRYRALIRWGHRAVQHVQPQKRLLDAYIRQRMATAARTKWFDESPEEEERRFRNTLEMLRTAGDYRGIEHKLVKNLTHMHWGRTGRKRQVVRAGKSKKIQAAIEAGNYLEGSIEETKKAFMKQTHVYV